MAPPFPPSRRSPGFLLAVALAQAGGVIGYLPLLALLLPLKVEEIAGDARVGVLTIGVLAGAIAASAANVLFGWLSDRSLERGGGRRRWVVVGLVLLAASLAAIDASGSPEALIASVVLFQFGINAVLAPLFAIQADEVPDVQKGVAGGLLSLGPPLASLLGAVLVTITADASVRLIAVAGTCALCLTPLLLTAPAIGSEPDPAVPDDGEPRTVAAAALARLLVQVAGNVLTLYLLYYFQSILPDTPSTVLGGSVGTLLVVGYVIPVPIAILVGRWSDASGRRRSFLVMAASVAAAGLVVMACATTWNSGAIGFCLYAIGAGVFLSLNTALTMQVLPDRRRRGRDLGVVNLTNTLPALLGLALTWLLADRQDFHLLMLALAGLTIAAVLPLFARFRSGGERPPPRPDMGGSARQG